MKKALDPTTQAVIDPGVEPIDLLPLPCFDLDATGTIIRINRAACSFFKMQMEEMTGKSVWNFSIAENMDNGRELFFTAFHSEDEPPPAIRAFFTNTGQYMTCQMYRRQIKDAAGQPIALRHMLVDISQLEYEREEARRNRLWLESVLSSVSDGVIVADVLGFIRFVNLATVEMLGWTEKELIGSVLDKKMPVLSYQSLDGNPYWHNQRIERHCRGIVTILNSRREEVRIEVSTSPILDKEMGSTLGFVSIGRSLPGLAETSGTQPAKETSQGLDPLAATEVAEG